MINECNYMQGSEGNVDPQHLSFLHRVDTGAQVTYGSYLAAMRHRLSSRADSVGPAGGDEPGYRRKSALCAYDQFHHAE